MWGLRRADEGNNAQHLSPGSVMMLATEYWWKVCLRLKLRQSAGDAFQEFFCVMMGKVHASDFVRVRPFGQKGDKGCDGYLQSSGKVFQCYGALNGDKGKVDYLIGKMEEDFNKAKKNLMSIMKEWHMVHNLVDGLPVEAILKLDELQKANPSIKFGFIGLEGFEELILQLDQAPIEDLLGPLATNKDAQDVQVAEIQALIKGVVSGIDGNTAPPGDISPVPSDKLDANGLPPYWRSLVSGGWQNAHIVGSYLDAHHDPLIGENIASLFRARYQYLRAQGLASASIMDGLYEFVTGIGSVSPARQVAAQAVLAHLFESCDIFENLTLGAKA
jgi:hypothetical protein